MRSASAAAPPLAALLFVACGVTSSAAPAVRAVYQTTTLSGASYTLDTGALDRPTLLVFWASWCDSCNREAPAVVRLGERLKGRLEIILVGVDEEREAAAGYLFRHGLSYECIWDPDLALADSFGVEGTPTLILLAADGALAGRGRELSEVEGTIGQTVELDAQP